MTIRINHLINIAIFQLNLNKIKVIIPESSIFGFTVDSIEAIDALLPDITTTKIIKNKENVPEVAIMGDAAMSAALQTYTN